MDLSITAALALFVLITLSTVVFFAARRFNLPYTVLLVTVGLFIVPIVNLPYLKNILGFLDDMVLTPELLFYIFLPILIFESGFNMNIQKILSSAWVISLMSVISLLISTLLIAVSLYFLMPVIGINMPLSIALLFGALISPTDPVAALSIFKAAGVPTRLANIFEGESLLNDGTAMALFFVMLGIATTGFHGSETVLHGFIEFSLMVFLGIGFGLLMAAVFSYALRFTKSNEFVTVTLMLISAHIVFILCEMINQSGVVHISPIIATAVSSLFMGNYSRRILVPRVDEYLSKLIEHIAFVVNSLVFLMAGFLFASAGVDFIELWLPILITVIVVAIARVISIYSVTFPLSLTKLEEPIPSSWQKLLAWGSLRGALSIIIVMLIPKDFTVPGWTLEYSPHDFLLALTIGCILATLFIKAPLIKPIMEKLGITNSNPLTEAHEADFAIYYLMKQMSQLDEYKTKRFLSDEQYNLAANKVTDKLKEAEAQRQEIVAKYGMDLFKQSLHMAMVNVEKTMLKRLLSNNEVSEKTFRKIYSKLNGRLNKIEDSKESTNRINNHRNHSDIFEHMVNFIQTPFERNRELTRLQRLEYYRAQMVIANKAINVVEEMQTGLNAPVFLSDAYDDLVSLYRVYKQRSRKKAEDLMLSSKEDLSPYLENLAHRSLEASGSRAIAYLHENGLADEHMQEAIQHGWKVLPD